MGRRIAVVGAGVVGLSSALILQQQNPNDQVTILSERFSNETVSSGAGGFFRPCLTENGVTPIENLRKWYTDSWKFYKNLARSPHAEESGHSFVSGMSALNEPLDSPTVELIRNLTSDFQELSPEKLRKMNFDGFKFGYSFTTIIISTPKYMAYLTKMFRKARGTIVQKKVERIADLANEFDLVVNCCGLGGRDLMSDDKMFPIKGHIVYVDAPWMNRFFYSKEVYLLPHPDKLLIGALKDKGNGSMVAEPEVRETTLAKAIEFFPQLSTAKVIGEWIGLRPGRDEIRLETEFITTESGSLLPVIHNYGHGGHGVSMSWGCGLNAAKLVHEALESVRARI